MRGSFVSAMFLFAGLVTASRLETATNDNDAIIKELTKAIQDLQEPEPKHEQPQQVNENSAIEANKKAEISPHEANNKLDSGW